MPHYGFRFWNPRGNYGEEIMQNWVPISPDPVPNWNLLRIETMAGRNYIPIRRPLWRPVWNLGISL